VTLGLLLLNDVVDGANFADKVRLWAHTLGGRPRASIRSQVIPACPHPWPCPAALQRCLHDTAEIQ
jgi:hypothetical protein